MTRTLTVLAPGPLTTVQDDGRPGQAALGIGRSGACDRASAALANRLVGNPVDAALLEVTFGGLALRADGDLLVVSTGARCPGAPHAAPTVLRAGSELRLGAPVSGLRSYLAVRGGIDVPPVLGSRATDLLSGLGPAVLAAGDVLPIGPPAASLPGVDLAPVADPPAGEVTVPVLRGPRDDWFGDPGWADLTRQAWTVTSESNRVGLRLDGPPLTRLRSGEPVPQSTAMFGSGLVVASVGSGRTRAGVPPSSPLWTLADGSFQNWASRPVVAIVRVVALTVGVTADGPARLSAETR